jgi:hypothetical protein
MKDPSARDHASIECRIRDTAGSAIYRSAIPYVAHLEKSACFQGGKRSYQNKYPGAAGAAIRDVTTAMVARIEGATTAAWRLAAQ